MQIHFEPLSETNQVSGQIQNILGLATPNGRTCLQLAVENFAELALIAREEPGVTWRRVNSCFSWLRERLLNDVHEKGRNTSIWRVLFLCSLVEQQRVDHDPSRGASASCLEAADVLFRSMGNDYAAVAQRYVISIIAITNLVLLDRKSRDYGAMNVAEYGELGVLVRMRDKYHRIVKLRKTGGDGAVAESLTETWCDTSNYALIGQALHLNHWFVPEEEQQNHWYAPKEPILAQ